MKILLAGSLFAILTSLEPTQVIAQGPPVFLDSCTVANNVHFKHFPMPGQIVPGEFDVLKPCPTVGNTLIKIANASAGKAKSIQMQLQFTRGLLTRATAKSSGQKDFEHLLKQLSKQFGRPTKLVASKGRRTYTWDMNFAAKCKIALNYALEDHSAVAIIESFVR